MSNWSRLMLLSAAVVAAGCGNDAGGTQTTAQPSQAAASVRVMNVEVATVAPEPFEDVIGITGTVLPERDVTVAAEESGVIREVYTAKGQRVRAGDAIAKIDDRVLRAQFEQATAEAALARETYERQRRLWEEEKIGSEMNYLRAKYGAETAAANARLLSARLERTMVRAPLGGVLDDRFVEVGSMVAPGTPVGRVLDIDTLKVSGGVPERYAGDIRTGSTASVSFDNLAGRQFTGRIRFVGAAVSESNRTFPVEVAIPNRAGGLKPGMIAKVTLVRGGKRQALLVPREAVLRTEHGYIVYVVQEQNGRPIAQAVSVVTGPGAGNRVVIDSGIKTGDRVVIVGQHQVANGDVVQIVQRGAVGQ